MAGKTAAQRQKEYRESMKSKGFKSILIWVDAQGNKAGAQLKPVQHKTEQQLHSRQHEKNAEAAQKWQEELQAEQLKAVRAEGRRLARQQDKAFSIGRITGLCETAAFFVYKRRPDIAKMLLDYYSIDREKAEAALQADKRVKSLKLAELDKAHIWDLEQKNEYI